jgi:hypothetical protein
VANPDNISRLGMTGSVRGKKRGVNSGGAAGATLGQTNFHRLQPTIPVTITNKIKTPIRNTLTRLPVRNPLVGGTNHFHAHQK